MEEIGIFEAKTKFSSLCARVADTGNPMLVKRRGEPLVMITPVTAKVAPREGILDSWRRWAADTGEIDDSTFVETWKHRSGPKPSPFEDDELAT